VRGLRTSSWIGQDRALLFLKSVVSSATMVFFRFVRYSAHGVIEVGKDTKEEVARVLRADHLAGVTIWRFRGVTPLEGL